MACALQTVASTALNLILDDKIRIDSVQISNRLDVEYFLMGSVV